MFSISVWQEWLPYVGHNIGTLAGSDQDQIAITSVILCWLDPLILYIIWHMVIAHGNEILGAMVEYPWALTRDTAVFSELINVTNLCVQ